MKIKGRELRQIIREVLSEGAFDSAAYIAGRIEPAYRPEALEPARPRALPPLPDTREARVFSLIVKNISRLLDNPDVAFIMQQLNSAAGNIASKASSEGAEAAVRSLLSSYERWSENPAAGRKATRPISGREDLEAYKEELRQKFKASLGRIERELAPVRGGPPPMFDPEEMADAEDDSFFGGPPELSPEEMEDMWGDDEPDDVPHDSGPEWALKQGFDHRRKRGYRNY